MKYTVAQDQTLLEALSCMSQDSSKTTLRSWIKDGRISVDGEMAKIATDTVSKGQTITLNAKKRQVEEGLTIYYEDKDLVVIEKPAGLLSVASNFEKGKTAHAILKNHYRPRRVFVVHRIDQETSGTMLFALSEQARDLMKDLFEKHDIERSYIAIVEGNVIPPSGTWKSYIYEDDRYRMHTTNDPKKGQLAVTHYKVLTSTNKYTALKLTLETGRKNQIRLHCQEAGYPVVGDEKYGSTRNPIRRLCLHAYSLAFYHPIKEKKMQFKSQIPESFHKLISLRSEDAL